MKFHRTLLLFRDSIFVPIVNVLTSIYCGFVIFSVLGYMAQEKGVQVKDVAASGKVQPQMDFDKNTLYLSRPYDVSSFLYNCCFVWFSLYLS